jgi:hypothetical protein
MADDNKLSTYIQGKLPAFYEQLSTEEKQVALSKMFESHQELSKLAAEKHIKSAIASGDLNEVLRFVDELSSKNKIYTVDKSLETGSGKMTVHIKGGDTKFIVPIMIVLVILILGILFIVFRR